MGEFKVVGRASGTGAFKELDRASGSGAFKTLEWEGVVPDIGGDAINRAYSGAAGYTLMTNENPAAAAGTVTKINAYMAANADNVHVGIQYLISGTTYKCRSSAELGALTAGLHSDLDVSLSVMTGDYIAVYCDTEHIDRTHDTSGGYYTYWYYQGNNCRAGYQRTFTYGSSNKTGLSINGVF